MRLKSLLLEFRPYLITGLICAAILLPTSIIFYISKKQQENFDARNTTKYHPPDISLPDIAGNMVKLKSIRGPGFVTVWTSWCGPCREELKELESKDLGNLRYVAINADDEESEALDFLKTHAIKRPTILFDAKSIHLRVEGYPTTFIINADGTWLGPLKYVAAKDIFQEISHVLNKREFKPYKITKQANDRFWDATIWQYFYWLMSAGGALFFAVLLTSIWAQMPTSKLLVITLYANFLLASLERLDFFRLSKHVSVRGGIIQEAIIMIYYSSMTWGTLISIGILLVIHKQLRAANGA
jgi:thiol-disulfide isomerase/thioredoxin